MKIHAKGRFFVLGILVLTILMVSNIAIAQMDDSGIANTFRFRNIGPANMVGRITDVEALDDNYATVYIGAAAGGIWKSTNAGVNWTHLFNSESTASIGDIAIYQKDPNIIYVGTGEGNTRNSISWGDGMFKSTDGGETFEQIGLESTHHISRVIIHPDNPNKVYVAAQGHLWGYEGDRGLFMTEDGGRTWQKLTNGLPDDGKTGGCDLVINPENPDVLFVSMWERLRQPWRFDSGGPNGGLGNGGIYKTENGGRSWTKMTNGLPEGNIGRVGLSIYKKDPNIVMALLEHEFQPSRGGGGRGGGGGGRGGQGAQEPNPDYEDMSKLGTGIYRTEDGGRTWKFLNRFNNRPFYYSQIRINPLDDQKVYLCTTNLQYSTDGGKTFSQPRISGNFHPDFHAMWMDPTNENRWYNASDGGVNITHDGGLSYDFLNTFCVSQFYAIAVDMREPYYVYGGLQDNGTWGAPSNSRDRNGIKNKDWFNIGGGDGFYAQVDPEDWRTVYSESQGGSIGRINVETRESGRIRPGAQNIINVTEYFPDVQQPQAGGRGGAGMQQQMGGRGGGFRMRFNWNSPILISPHNAKTVFFGGNHLLKSINRGDNWKIISPDLTTNDPVKQSRDTGGITNDATGAENYCTIVTVSESHVTPGVIWAGTDDGLVHVTRNDGVSWSNVRGNIPEVPEGLWVSRLEAGHFGEGTAYVTFDGHRSDNFRPWVFKTNDYGLSWSKITGGLPSNEVANVIREDLINPNLLFLGTESGLFVSLNDGDNWERFMNNLPTVPVDDIVIHPRENDLVLGTHGLGIWICDDITPLQQMTADVTASDAHLMKPKTVTQWTNISQGGYEPLDYFTGENPRPQARVSFYLGNSVTDGELVITDVTGRQKHTAQMEMQPGLNNYIWNGSFDPVAFNAAEQVLVDEYNNTQDQQRRMEIMNQVRASVEGRGEMFSGMGGGGRGGMQGMAQRGGGRGGRGGGRIQVGTYVVKLTAGGRTMVETLVVRPDPLLNR
ncbi:WD40/YVTN/BNR-like repeat-containing protein [candidate division KSB1 bacterium]